MIIWNVFNKTGSRKTEASYILKNKKNQNQYQNLHRCTENQTNPSNTSWETVKINFKFQNLAKQNVPCLDSHYSLLPVRKKNSHMENMLQHMYFKIPFKILIFVKNWIKNGWPRNPCSNEKIRSSTGNDVIVKICENRNWIWP